MSNRIPLGQFGYKLTPLGGGLYKCPSCDQPSLYVDTRDENNVSFTCANGCSQFQVLDSLGLLPDAVVYVGNGSAAEHEQQQQESVTEEKRAEMKKELDALAGGDVLSLGITENFIEAETVKSIAYKIVSENATVE